MNQIPFMKLQYAPEQDTSWAGELTHCRSDNYEDRGCSEGGRRLIRNTAPVKKKVDSTGTRTPLSSSQSFRPLDERND